MVFGCYAQVQVPTNFKSELSGHWLFNKSETIINFRSSDMSKAEVKRFSSILKPAELIITDKIYSSHIQGRKIRETPYSIISISDDGVHFKLQLKDPRIPLNIQVLEVRVVNNKLFLPTLKGQMKFTIKNYNKPSYRKLFTGSAKAFMISTA